MLNRKIFCTFFLTLFNLNSIKCDNNIGYLIHDILRRESISKNFITSRVANDGYPLETHNTVTPDEYILTLHRIPYSPKTKCKKKPSAPVYLHHGLFCNSDTWLIAGNNRSLAYILSDAGYDVWLGNARGTTHSRAHNTLNPNSFEYWDFTWHQIGIYDNPTNIDYILRVTKQKQLHYIGHSQGTTSFFVMTSLKPEYNQKIKTMHALSPVAFMKHTTSVFFTVPNRLLELLSFLAKYLGFSEILPNTHISRALEYSCSVADLTMNICSQLLFIGGGESSEQFQPEYVSELFKVSPAGASTFQLLHYAQSITTGKFQSYDYGKLENQRKYGQETPIVYPLQKITAPLYFYVSGNDYIANLNDVKLLINGLSKKPVYIEVKDKKWNHFDYVIGKNAKELVYNRVLNYMYKADLIDKENCLPRI